MVTYWRRLTYIQRNGRAGRPRGFRSRVRRRTHPTYAGLGRVGLIRFSSSQPAQYILTRSPCTKTSLSMVQNDYVLGSTPSSASRASSKSFWVTLKSVGSKNRPSGSLGSCFIMTAGWLFTASVTLSERARKLSTENPPPQRIWSCSCGCVGRKEVIMDQSRDWRYRRDLSLSFPSARAIRRTDQVPPLPLEGVDLTT